MQIGFPNRKVYVINTSTADVKPILPFFSNPKIQKIIFNSVFEQMFIQRYYNTFIRGVWDSMTSEQVILSAKRPNSLADVAFKYTGEVLDKTQQTSFVGMKPGEMFTEQQLKYAAKDVSMMMFDIADKQKQILEDEGMLEIAQLESDCAGVIAAMELEGLPINTQLWREKLADTRIKQAEARETFISAVFDAPNSKMAEQLGMFERYGFNVSSPQKVKEALASIGIEVESTDARIIENIDHPATRALTTFRKQDKILTTYGESLLSAIHPFTNRFHPDFQQIGAETGRMSCREPNVQNIPEDFRAFVGYLDDFDIVGADYGQMELRIIAQITEDPNLIKAFNSGDDPHKGTASLMFSVPLDEVTKEQRYIAKTINFGLAYGMGPNKLMDELNKGRDDKDKLKINKAYELVNIHKQTYKKVHDWFAYSGDHALVRGYSTTLLKRKRYFTRPSGILDQESLAKQLGAIKRAAGNAPIQGTNADITKKAMIAIHDEILAYGFKARIINVVHDEIILLAHKSQSEALKEVVEDAMIDAARDIITLVPVVAEGYISKNWKK